MTPPQHKILGESSTKRSQKLIAHTKSVIDDMVEKGIPLTVERVSLNAGCSKSFTQTSHIKNGIRTLKNQYFSPQNTLMRLFFSVPMHPACILGDAEQSWL